MTSVGATDPASSGAASAGHPPAWLAAMPPEYIARLAPPTIAGPLGGIARKPRWPGVVGSISIGLGVLGVLFAAVTIFSQALSGHFAAAVPGQGGVFAAQQKWLRESIVVQTGSIVIAAVLLAAGIALLRRSPRTWLLFLVWIPLRIVGATAVTIINYLMQRDQFAAMSAMPTSAGAAPAAIMGTITDFTIVGTAIGYGIWALLWPIFILIWFRRPVIRAQMREWPALAPARRPA